MTEPRLCYVDEPWAYFTTAPLDWNDAPYEHNAGPPYEWAPRRDMAPYTVTRCAYDGPLATPRDGHFNSPWTVQQINAGAVAWLRTDKYHDGPPVAIPAGTTFEDFTRLVERAGGTVYVPRPRT